jgi:hypothetical protein
MEATKDAVKSIALFNEISVRVLASDFNYVVVLGHDERFKRYGVALEEEKFTTMFEEWRRLWPSGPGCRITPTVDKEGWLEELEKGYASTGETHLKFYTVAALSRGTPV